MRNNLRLFLLGCFLCAVAGLFWFLNSSTSSIIASNARAVMMGPDMFALYVDVENLGEPDIVTGISSEETGDAFFMGGADGRDLAVPALSKASFASDGAHIVFRPEGETPKDGTLITFMMEFETAGRVPVKAVVDAMKTTNEGMDHSMHGAANAFKVEDASLAPKVEMSAEENSSGGWELAIKTDNFEFVEPISEPAEHIDGEGHGHLYLNGLKLRRLYTNTATVGKLPVGEHIVSVTLNTNDHRAYSAGENLVSASVVIKAD